MKQFLTLGIATCALSCAPNVQEIKKDKQPTNDAPPQTIIEQLRTDFREQALSRLSAELAKTGQRLDETAQCADTRDNFGNFSNSGFDKDSLKNDAYDAQLEKSLREQNLAFIDLRSFGDYKTRNYVILVATQEGKKEVYKTRGTLPAQGISSQRAWICMQAPPMILEKMEGWGEKEFDNFIKGRKPVSAVSKVELVETHDVRAEHRSSETKCKDGECVTTQTGGKVERREVSIEPVESPADGPVPDKLPSEEELTQWPKAKLKIMHHNSFILLQRLAGKKSTLGHLPEYTEQIKFYEDLINLISDELGRREILHGVGTAVPDSLPSKTDLATWSGPNLLVTRSNALALLQRLKAKPELQRLPEYSEQIKFYEDFIKAINAELRMREIQH